MSQNKILNNLKNSVYEFEGLLELLTIRGEKSAELIPLLSARLQQINATFDSLKDDKAVAPAAPAPAPVAPAPVEAAPVEVAPVDTPVETARKAPAFCLNDRFRFRRNVFGGDETLFDRVCERISQMRDYEEAEEYFFGELGMDPENNDVEDFMTIIREYFGK